MVRVRRGTVSQKGIPFRDKRSTGTPLDDLICSAPEADLDVYRAMEIASEGLEALITIMLETGFSPYADDSEHR